VLPGLVGCIQATETMKLILGVGEPLIGRFLILDALRMRFRDLKLRKDPDCPVCGTHPTVTKLIDYDQFCGIAPAAPEPVTVDNATEITSVELKKRLDRGDRLTIVDVREPNEYQINRIGGSVLIPLNDVPATRTVAQVVAQVTQYRLENGGLRLVLYDAGSYLNAVIPLPSCLSAKTRARPQLAAVWKQFVGACAQPTSSWQPLGAIAYVGGIGFWGQKRALKGAARNGAELHPVTDIRIVAGC